MYRDSFLHINKLNCPNIEKIKNDLTVRERDFETGQMMTFTYYEETNNELLVPRFYFNQPDIIDKTMLGRDIKVKSKIKFRNENQKMASDFIINDKQGLIKCPPGFGKTVITIHAICQISKRTLVLVDQRNLVEQWKERFLEHTDINIDSIDHMKDLELTKSYITITTIQNLLAKFRKSKTDLINFMKQSEYGLVIFDEVHTLIGPEKFTNVCSILYANRLFGLSATPFRDGIRKKIIQYWLSNNYFDYDKYNIMPKIVTVKFNSNIPVKTQKWIYWSKNFNLGKYYKSLFKHTDFLRMICKIVVKLYNEDRHILLLVGRIKNKFLDDLKTILINEYHINENDISIYIGGVDKSEVKRKIVLSNYIMAYKGLDEPSLDTLVLMTSTYSDIYIEQSVGRILRIHENKKQPLVIDFCDLSYNELKDAYDTRLILYKKLNFIVK